MDWEQEKTLLELDVSNLTVRLNECRKELRKAKRAATRKRVPVLVRVDANGDVSVFGRDVEVEIVSTPVGEFSPAAQVLVEEWIDVNLPERFRDLHLPGYCVATVNPRSCRTLTETYAAFAAQETHAGLNKLLEKKGQQDAQKKKAHARPASSERRARRMG